MNVTAKMDDKVFAREAGRIAAFSGKAMQEVCREQAGLFVADAMRFTPPFGDAPMTESLEEQQRIGKNAVSRDVQKAFKRLGDLDVVSNGTAIGIRLLDLVLNKKNFIVAEELLKRIKIATLGIIEKPTKELHNGRRSSRGRVRGDRHSYLVLDNAALVKFIAEKEKKVGLAKSGWIKAIRALNSYRTRKVPSPRWISAHNGQGIYFESQPGEKTFVEIGNAVPHAQKHADKIMNRAWQNRIRNVQKQADIQERMIARRAKAAGLT